MTSHTWAVFVIKYIWEDFPPFVFLHRELLPVCCTESYSRSVAPRASPGLLHRELLPICCTESYSRSVAPRAFNALPVLCHALQRHAACIGPVWCSNACDLTNTNHSITWHTRRMIRLCTASSAAQAAKGCPSQELKNPKCTP